MTARRHTTLSIVAGVALAACSDTNPVAPAPPAYVSSAVVVVPENDLARVLEVTGTGWDSMAARVLAPDGQLRERTPAVVAGTNGADVPVLGLLAGTSYRITVELWDGATPVATADTFLVTTAALPAWIPAIGATGATPVGGYTALSLPDGGVIVDDEGRVRWYRHSPNGVLNSFQAHPDGSYTLLADGTTAQGVPVLDPLGRETGRLQCANGRPIRFHEVRIEADGSAWVMCDETRSMDLSGLGGHPAAQVSATVLQHLDPSGVLLFEWNAFDHFDITDLPLAARTGENVNFTHGNSIEFDGPDALLLSFRSLNEVTRIHRTTGAVEWRLGGLASTLAIANDPKGGFQRQHGLRLAAGGVVQFLDNGEAAPSRLVRYGVDAGTSTADFEWEFVDDPATFTPVGGSSQVLGDGGALVSFGQAGRVIEVDATGARRWELTGLDGLYVFRAERIGALYR